MPTTSVSSLIEVLAKILPANQLQEVKRWQARFPHSRALCQELVRRGWLTPFQTSLILAGRAGELFVGPCLLLERIAEGGFGQVFKARHQKLNRLVAVKILRPELAKDHEAVQRFHREIEVASQLSHANLVQAYEAGMIGGKLVLVMEYVEGRNLEEIVGRAGPLRVSQAWAYLRQAAVGLQYAHERGLIHRDIKPSNLLISADGVRDTVKILDLGLARLREPAPGSTTSNLTVLGSQSVMQGSPDYMSPEQALDFHCADIRSDIYSLGCTFFFLLTGKPPFAGGSLAEKLMKHQQAEPPVEPLSGLPPEVSAVLRRMLAKRPADRFQTPGELVEHLKNQYAAASNQSKTDTEPEITGIRSAAVTVWDSITLRRGSFLRRRRWFLLIGVLALLLLVPLVRLFLPAARTPAAATGTSAASQSLEVAITHCSTGKKLTVTDLRVGALLYMDRTYTITRVSEGLAGGLLIQTANNDKNVKDQAYLKLAVNQDVNVYVGYDRRSSARPAWLAESAGWNQVNEVLGSTTEVAANPSFLVYQKGFPAGEIVLQANQGQGAAGAGSNYIVVVKAVR